MNLRFKKKSKEIPEPIWAHVFTRSLIIFIKLNLVTNFNFHWYEFFNQLYRESIFSRLIINTYEGMALLSAIPTNAFCSGVPVQTVTKSPLFEV